MNQETHVRIVEWEPLTLFIGDVHGKFRQYREIIRNHKNTIQVGDMGVGFRHPLTENWLANPPYDAMVEGNHRFIRGNHDNPAVCRRHSQYIPDGMVMNDVMFIGGATSIDKDFRVPEYTWWDDEELSQEELNGLVSIYSVMRPRIMVTHEIPHWVAEAMGYRLFKLDNSSRTRDAFTVMHEIHRPEIWIYGHWHISFDNVVRDTRWVCLNELEAKEIDVGLDQHEI